jgi:hypothetical protein
MRPVRSASFEEFVLWYLTRERQKRNQPVDLSGRSSASLLAEMRRSHPDKLRPWFEGGRWSIVSLEAIAEAMSLVCLDNWEIRRNRLVNGYGNRLVRMVVAAARATVYFDNPDVIRRNSVEGHYRQQRIVAFRKSWPELRGDERLTICDLDAAEKAEHPDGTYYLHDGLGRLLAYLYAVLYEGREYRPIEVFLAEQY